MTRHLWPLSTSVSRAWRRPSRPFGYYPAGRAPRRSTIGRYVSGLVDSLLQCLFVHHGGDGDVFAGRCRCCRRRWCCPPTGGGLCASHDLAELGVDVFSRHRTGLERVVEFADQHTDRGASGTTIDAARMAGSRSRWLFSCGGSVSSTDEDRFRHWIHGRAWRQRLHGEGRRAKLRLGLGGIGLPVEQRDGNEEDVAGRPQPTLDFVLDVVEVTAPVLCGVADEKDAHVNREQRGARTNLQPALLTA